MHGDSSSLGTHGQPLAAVTVAQHVEAADGREHLHQPLGLHLISVQREHHNVHDLTISKLNSEECNIKQK